MTRLTTIFAICMAVALSPKAQAVTISFDTADATMSSVSTAGFVVTTANTPVLPSDASFTVPFVSAANIAPIGPFFGLSPLEGRFARYEFSLPTGFANFNFDLDTAFDDQIVVYLNDTVVAIDEGLTCQIYPGASCVLNVNSSGNVTGLGGLWDLVTSSVPLLEGINELTIYVNDRGGGALAGLGGFAGEISYDVSPPPTEMLEPGTFAVLGLGLFGLVIARRRRAAWSRTFV